MSVSPVGSSSQSGPHPLLQKARTLAPVVLGLGLFALGVFALYRLLAPVDLKSVFLHARSTPWATLAAALAATLAGYLALIGYDWSALRYLGRKVPFPVVAVGGFLGYSFGNTVGMGAISGGAVRYRIYSAFGLNAYEVAAVSTFVSLAFGFGITIIGLTALAIHPYALAGLLPWPPELIRLIAAATVIVAIAIVFYLSLSRGTLKIRNIEISAPSPRVLLGQLLFSAADTAMAALTLYVLLPQGAPDFLTFVAIFAAALLAGVASHVPGGVGVFESIIIAGLPATAPIEQVAAALLLFRMIYYLLPFSVALVFVAVNEARVASGPVARLLGDIPEQMLPVTQAVSSVSPAIVGTTGFTLGVWLLLLALMPSVQPETIEPGDYFTAALLEGGALLSAAVGIVLVLLSQGLFRRISGAFWLTLTALSAGAFASLLNGFDLEGAIILAGAAIVLLPFRREFFRSAKLTQNVMSPAWIALVAGIALSAAAFLFLVHAATPYSTGVWTDFSGAANMPRALRSAVLASAIATVFMIYLAMQPARSRNEPQDAAAFEKAANVIAAQDDPAANLALSGDKRLFFSDAGDAFVMYATRGRSWVAYSDPVGNEDTVRELAWIFFDAAYAANARPVFYEISDRYLALFVEMGLSLHKIGEEAVVKLPAFSLAGRGFKTMRAAHNKARRSGLEFDVLAPPHSAALMAEIREVSDAWLAEKTGREKGFSIGRFDEAYLQNFPIATVRLDGGIVAFANILLAGGKNNVAIDLMRYRPEHARGMMEFLFLEAIEHYRAAGYREFSLGMAPLAGLEAKHGTRLWNRFGSILYRHGGGFYNFEGLRTFKNKFHPEWRPRFLAVPGSLPPIAALRDVTLLIAGGAKGLASK